ncbi:hypothetical protein AWENTII_002303 [Aspergillus wentii]
MLGGPFVRFSGNFDHQLSQIFIVEQSYCRPTKLAGVIDQLLDHMGPNIRDHDIVGLGLAAFLQMLAEGGFDCLYVGGDDLWGPGGSSARKSGIGSAFGTSGFMPIPTFEGGDGVESDGVDVMVGVRIAVFRRQFANR